MTKFMIEMDKKFICFCWNMYNRCNSNNKRCDGFLEDRPGCCPLVEVKEEDSLGVDKSLRIALDDNGWDK